MITTGNVLQQDKGCLHYPSLILTVILLRYRQGSNRLSLFTGVNFRYVEIPLNNRSKNTRTLPALFLIIIIIVFISEGYTFSKMQSNLP